MSKVAVYFFEHIDANLNADVRAPRMATLDAIQRVRGTPSMDTRFEVDESQLDGNGFYPPKLSQEI